jgi:hypothetical protein
MLTDPQSVTIGGTAISLPRTGVGDGTANYTKDDGNVALKVSHRKVRGRVQTLIRLDQVKVAADPLLAGVNREAKAATWLVIDRPTVGFTITEQADLVKGLNNALSASTFALLTRLLAGES